MELIKVNYNNVALKTPKAVAPYIFCYRKYGQQENERIIFIVVQDNILEENFFKDFHFEVYVDDILVAYLNKNSDHKIVLTNEDFYNKTTVNVRISGYYTDGRSRKNFPQIIRQVKTFPYCSDNIFCSDEIKVNDLLEGYLVNKTFYLTKIDDRVYTDEAKKENGVFYYDIETNILYSWSSADNKFIKL